MNKEVLVLVKLVDGNRGTHGIIGPVTKRKYGYRRHGDQFYVLEADVKSFVLNKIVEVLQEEGAPEPKAEASASDEALLALNGINPERLAKLHKAGMDSMQALAAANGDTLRELLDTSPAVVTRIQNAARQSLENPE